MGLYGMRGVGKTTLVRHIYNQVLAEGTLNAFWVDVSQDSYFSKLQHDIAEELGLEIDMNKNKNDTLREAELSKGLMRKQKFSSFWMMFGARLI